MNEIENLALKRLSDIGGAADENDLLLHFIYAYQDGRSTITTDEAKQAIAKIDGIIAALEWVLGE